MYTSEHSAFITKKKGKNLNMQSIVILGPLLHETDSYACLMQKISKDNLH